jgi:hypothetical protein
MWYRSGISQIARETHATGRTSQTAVAGGNTILPTLWIHDADSDQRQTANVTNGLAARTDHAAHLSERTKPLPPILRALILAQLY